MKETNGTVVSVSKQWWLKVNTKAVRSGPLDGATFPYIIKVQYTVDGKEYTCKKWISPGAYVPNKGALLKVMYDESKPSKGKVVD